MSKSTIHPHHKMYDKHSKGGHVDHMGKDHWEKKEDQLGVCGEKYAGEFSNPEDLKRLNDGLATYTKKNKFKY